MPKNNRTSDNWQSAELQASLQRVSEHLRGMLTLPADITLGQGLDFAPTGKRLRPALVILCAGLFGAVNTTCERAAAALEAVHLASLFHDDVIDETDLRRGKPTLSALSSNKCAILLGDHTLAQATAVLASLNNLEIVAIMSQAAIAMSQGQLLELEHQGDTATSTACYAEIIHGKTATLFKACCDIGAALNNAPLDWRQKLRCYGENVGMAFQISDDILDIWGDEKQLGKPTFTDIAERKYTLPVLLALERLEPARRLRLQELLEQEINANNRQDILELLDGCGAREQALKRVQFHSHAAWEILGELKERPQGQALADIAIWTAQRQA